MTDITAEQELIEKLSDPMWRICSGQLYKIITKGEGDDPLVLPFIPNKAKRKFIKRLHNRNVILKSRHLGFTTLIAILWLDHALFNPNSRCGIIAHNQEAAEIIFRDKVKFAYYNLPEVLRSAFPIKKDSAIELLFAHNNSSIRVATSMRSGTIHRLHISELGKICAKFPDKAKEIVTGSIPAVPLSGILVIESTSEGRDGEFYEITQSAIASSKSGAKLTNREYRFNFFPWFDADEYEMDPATVVLSEKDHEYFDDIESKVGMKISNRKRAWYVATRDADFSGKDELMWQEYPSTADEAFQKSTVGCYYTKEMTAVRACNRALMTRSILPF